MRLQVLQDGQGKTTGVFIPIEDWIILKRQYPDIESADWEVPQWEKDILDNRLEAIAKNGERLKPGEDLLKILKRN